MVIEGLVLRPLFRLVQFVGPPLQISGYGQLNSYRRYCRAVSEANCLDGDAEEDSEQ